MTMSKQDYELIARVLRTARQNGHVNDARQQELLAGYFADELRATNPRFNRERFVAACMGQDSHDSAGRRVRYSA